MKRLIRIGAVAAIAIAAVVGYRMAGQFVSVARAEQCVLTVLRSEDLTFLVTKKVVTRVLVEQSEVHPLLGKREGFLTAKVQVYYGIDLEKLEQDDVRREEGRLTVKLPEVEMLDFVVEWDSVRFFARRSGLMVLRDWVMNRDQAKELRGQFEKAALQEVEKDGLAPARSEMVARLNQVVDVYAARAGAEVVFR